VQAGVSSGAAWTSYSGVSDSCWWRDGVLEWFVLPRGAYPNGQYANIVCDCQFWSLFLCLAALSKSWNGALYRFILVNPLGVFGAGSRSTYSWSRNDVYFQVASDHHSLSF